MTGARLSIQDLREKRNAAAQDVRKLLDTYPGNKWGADQQKTYDEKIAEVEDCDAQITREQKILDLTAEKHLKDVGARTHNVKKSEVVAIFDKWVRGGDTAVSAAEWQVVRNTMSEGTPSQGGYTVPTEVSSVFIDAMKQFGGMRKVAEIIKTASGAPLNYPTTDGTSEVGEIIAENQTATNQDMAFGVVGLNPYKFSSKVITVPWELLQDTVIDLESLINKRMQQRIGRAQNAYFTNGTGSGQPMGVVTAAGVGKVGLTGEATSLIYDDLIDLMHSVDPAYREAGTCKFMFRDSTLQFLRKLKDGNGRPIFIPGFYDNGIAGGIPDTLVGQQYQINQDMPAMAANAKPMLYGDFSKYIIRDVLDIQMFRFTDSAYTKQGQVGFMGWARSGGTLADVTAVKSFQNSAS